MLQPWQTGKVIRIENATEFTRRFWIELDSKQPFDFKPGQFVTLDLPIHEKPSKRWRSYSIASWPDGSNVIELVIVLLEGGAGTTYLFEHVQVGQRTDTARSPGFIYASRPIGKRSFSDLYRNRYRTIPRNGTSYLKSQYSAPGNFSDFRMQVVRRCTCIKKKWKNSN